MSHRQRRGKWGQTFLSNKRFQADSPCLPPQLLSLLSGKSRFLFPEAASTVLDLQMQWQGEAPSLRSSHLWGCSVRGPPSKASIGGCCRHPLCPRDASDLRIPVRSPSLAERQKTFFWGLSLAWAPLLAHPSLEGLFLKKGRGRFHPKSREA